MWGQKGEDKGLWTERVNTATGESSIKLHKPKVVWRSCKNFGEHFFEATANREWTCKHCQFIFTPIVGIHSLVDGKIVEKAPPS